MCSIQTEKKMKLDYKYKQLLLCAVCAILVYISLTNLESILTYAGTVYMVLKPFIYGAVMAFIINVPMKKIEDRLAKAGLKKYKRTVAYLLTLIIIIAAINLFFLIVMPQLIRTLGILIDKLERFIKLDTRPAGAKQGKSGLPVQVSGILPDKLERMDCKNQRRPSEFCRFPDRRRRRLSHRLCGRFYQFHTFIYIFCLSCYGQRENCRRP